MFMALIGADPPTNLMAEQNELGSVLVSWTAPSAPPAMGYRVTLQPGNVSIDAPSFIATVNLQPGVYNITVVALSQHLPSEAVGPVEVLVRGKNSHIAITRVN